MSDLINRDAVMLRVREFIGNPTYNENMLVNDLNALPSAEPERKKGEWIWDNKTAFERCRCSECGYYRQLKYPEPENYCPNCGAEMEETK